MAQVSDNTLHPLDEGTIRQRVVAQLKAHIVKGNFVPGQRLTEQQLASALNVSRGPLREAVRDLCDMGLLVSLPYKGLYVRSVTPEDLEELYSLRTTLETFAFERCWDKRTPEAIADLHSRSEALKEAIDLNVDGLRAIELELALHSWSFELSGHKLLQKSWESMQSNVYFYFSLHQRAHARKGPLRQSHDLYVELACGDSLDAMKAHLVDHMRQGFERTRDALSTSLFS